MLNLNLSLKKGGWVYIRPNTDTKDRFMFMLDKLRKLPVISFDRKKKCQLTSINHLDSLYDICREYNFSVTVTDKLEEYHQRFLARLELIKQARTNTEFHSDLWTDDPTCKVEPYQAQAINVCLTSKRYLIGDDMGVGKTVELIGAMCKAFDNGYNKAIIFVLNKLKYQWKDEILRFTKLKPEDISIVDPAVKFKCPLKIVESFNIRNKNSPCRNCKLMEQCKKEKDNPVLRWKRQVSTGRVVISNYEALDKIKDLIIKLGFDFIGMDEVTKLKNHNTKMSKAAQKMSSELPSHSIIIPMSGTFIENRVEEIYPALAIADRRVLGEWYNFRNRYLVLDHFNNVVGYKKEKELTRIINNWMIRRPIEEVWKDRPPLVEDTIMCDMEEDQRQFYNDAKNGCLDNIKDKVMQDKINLADIAPLLNYLIQICDTSEAIDPKKQYSIKFDIMKEKIMEIPQRHKIIIFSFFASKVIPLIAREIKSLKVGKALVITGKTKQKEGEEYKKLFMTDPNYRFLICSDAMGYGANLQAATYVINMDLPWNPAKLDQRIRRAYRRGQKESVTVYNLVTRDTIEDRILEKLGYKRQIFNQFINGGNLKAKKKGLSLKDLIDVLKS